MTFSDIIEFLDKADVFDNFQNVRWYHHLVDFSTLYLYYVLIFIKHHKEEKDFKVSKVILLKNISMVVDLLLSLFICTALLLILGSRFLPAYIVASIVGTKLLSTKILDKIFSSESERPIAPVIVNVNTEAPDDDDPANPGIFLLDTELEKFIPDIDAADIKHLDIITVLEKWGYVSQNQKCKMNDLSLFETDDEMVRHLLDMQALTENELLEARAILNISRLKKRPISRGEAAKLIMRIEERRTKEKGHGGATE